MVTELLDDFCPSCGRELPLHTVSGFCVPCTKLRYPNKAVCDNCGKVEARGQFRTKCQGCQNEEWLAKNADKIEAYMSIGLTLAMALVKIRGENRPICLSCGYKIRGGTKGRHFFCRATQQCKSAAIKYTHYKDRSGLSKEEALSETLNWLDDKRRENGSTG
jgi:hypothetical protein